MRTAQKSFSDIKLRCCRNSVFHSLLFSFFFFFRSRHEEQNVFCVKFSRNWCFQRRLIQSSCCCILLLIYYSESAGKPSCGDALHIPRQTRSVYMGLHTDLPKQYMLQKAFKKQMPGTNPKQNKLGLNLLSVSLKLDFLHGHWWENKARSCFPFTSELKSGCSSSPFTSSAKWWPSRIAVGWK